MAKKKTPKKAKKNAAKKVATKKSGTKNKKTSTMKKTTNKKSGKEKNKKQSNVQKDKKSTTSSKKNIKTKEKESKKKVEKSVKNEKKQNKNNKTVSKPKSKKIYDEEEEAIEKDLLEKDDLNEDNEEVTEVEEIDLSNIEPIISDPEPLLEEEEEVYVPKTRGRKKQIQLEVHHHQTMEEIIRNRPLQIDPTKKTYIVKKEDEPQPYVTSTKSSKERYSDKELKDFKEIILQRLKETKENYDQLKKFFTNEDDNGIDDTSPTFKMIEDGSDVMTKEEIEQQLARLEKYMIDLQNGLLRIENKTYGICTVTGKLIPKERLKSVPHATKSIEAKISRDI